MSETPYFVVDLEDWRELWDLSPGLRSLMAIKMV